MTNPDGAASGRSGPGWSHCNACGGALTPGAAFCTGCGAPSGGSGFAASLDGSSPAAQGGALTQAIAAPPRKSGVPWLKVGAAVLGVFAIGDGVLTMMSGAKGGGSPAPYTGLQVNTGWPTAKPAASVAASPQGAPGAAAADAAPAIGQGAPSPGFADVAPAAQSAMPGAPVAPGFPGPNAGGSGDLAGLASPTGMTRLESPVGAVFRSQMTGSPQASVLASAVLQSLGPYFDAPPQVVNQQADPSNQTVQIVLHGQKDGRQLGGMILVKSGGPNGGLAYLVLDDASQVGQTAGVMMGVAQRDLQSQGG